MKHLDDFLGRLDGVVKSVSGWTAKCPAHDDHSPSLSVGIGEENKLLLNCFAGCKLDAILDALGLEGSSLYPREEDSQQDDLPALRKEVQPAASPELVHEVYDELLKALSLEDGHRENLRRRGLDDGRIEEAGYRSVSFFRLNKVVPALRKQFGDALLDVPGFVTKDGKVKATELPRGLLIPVRNVGGRIAGLQVRCDEGESGGKYRWFSGQTSSGTPAHVPLGVGPCELLRVTEGPLKADVAFALDGTPTVGVAGVAAWKNVLPVVRQLKPKTVRLAFDADARIKPGVAKALSDCVRVLKEGDYDR